jgi:hypothetical protein
LLRAKILVITGTAHCNHHSNRHRNAAFQNFESQDQNTFRKELPSEDSSITRTQ